MKQSWFLVLVAKRSFYEDDAFFAGPLDSARGDISYLSSSSQYSNLISHIYSKKNASQINERRLLMLLNLFPVVVVKVVFKIRVSISRYYFYPALMVKEPFGAGRWKTFG